MTPEVTKAWMDILTEGRGLLITIVVIIMLASIGLTFLGGLFIAWKLGIMKTWHEDIATRNRENHILEIIIKICEKAGYKIDGSDTVNISNP